MAFISRLFFYASLCLGVGFLLVIGLGDKQRSVDIKSSLVLAASPLPPTQSLHSLKLQAIEAAQQGDYLRARLTAARTKDPLVRSLVDWIVAQTENDGFGDRRRQAFLETHPDWPASSLIKARMQDPAAPKSARGLVAYRQDVKPRFNEEWIAYIEALLKIDKQERAAEVIRQVWSSRTFYTADELAFIERFGGVLRPEDQIARMEWLLDNDHAVSGERQVERVPIADKAFYEARLKVLQGGEPANLSDLSDTQRKHPAFILPTIVDLESRWHITKAIELFEDTDALKPNPQLMFDLRLELARDAIYLKRYQKAYDLLSAHRLDGGEQAALAEQLAGWLALRYLDQPELASTHLERAISFDFGAVGAKAGFWLAQAYAKLGKSQQSHNAFKSCAKHKVSLYAQLCMEALGQKFDGDFKPSDKGTSSAVGHPLARAARLMDAAGDSKSSQLLLRALLEATENTEEKAASLRLIANLGFPRLSYYLGDEQIAKGFPVWTAARPLRDLTLRRMENIEDRAFLYSLIYQESRFDPEAKSHVGALGLAQLLPSTAKDMAQNHGLPFSEPRLILDPDYNAQLGWYYLQWLEKLMDKRSLYVLASYNAGLGRVREWRQEIGEAKPGYLGTLDWMEHIPFDETRRYVENIYANLMVYQSLLAGQAQPIKLTEALAS